MMSMNSWVVPTGPTGPTGLTGSAHETDITRECQVPSV